MSELLAERRISNKAFMGQYAAAIVVGVALAALCFMVPGLGIWSPLGILPVVGVAVWSYILRLSDCYRLMDDRIEVESGILTKKIENVELFRIRDVGLRQGLLGQVMNFGDVYVHSTDSSTPSVHIRGIDEPKVFYQELRERVTESRAAHRTMIIEEGREITEP
jgi:uncharacterized membrane protein YdbT with pleckstrin-like domain